MFVVTLINFYAEYMMRNAGLNESQARIKIARRSTNSITYADDTPSVAEVKGTKNPFDECERGEWKSWLKTQHSENKDHGLLSHHFMANRRGKSRNSGRLYFLTLFTFQNHGGQ